MNASGVWTQVYSLPGEIQIDTGHRRGSLVDFGVGVFHDFSRMNFGGNELMQRRTLTPQRADEFHLIFVIAGAELAARSARWDVLWPGI